VCVGSGGHREQRSGQRKKQKTLLEPGLCTPGGLESELNERPMHWRCFPGKAGQREAGWKTDTGPQEGECNGMGRESRLYPMSVWRTKRSLKSSDDIRFTCPRPTSGSAKPPGNFHMFHPSRNHGWCNTRTAVGFSAAEKAGARDTECRSVQHKVGQRLQAKC